ncbi:hypothetical protein [Microbacterium elymi]|uniref:hypothetical protein n=1 Tax=Microbacterium elymi TaxID=2909587 RepID=UPI00338ECEB6
MAHLVLTVVGDDRAGLVTALADLVARARRELGAQRTRRARGGIRGDRADRGGRRPQR